MTARPGRAAVLLLCIWLLGVALATTIGLLAVRLVAVQVGDPAVTPVSAAVAAGAGAVPTPRPAAVRPAAPRAPAPATRPPRAPRPAAPPAEAATFRSAGGSVGVQCTGEQARLVYATPAEGYALAERSVTGGRVEARFESAGQRVRMEVRCAAGRPRIVDVRTDGRGGDGGGSRDD